MTKLYEPTHPAVTDMIDSGNFVKGYTRSAWQGDDLVHQNLAVDRYGNAWVTQFIASHRDNFSHKQYTKWTAIDLSTYDLEGFIWCGTYKNSMGAK